MRQGACIFGAWESQFLWSPSNFLPLWRRFSTICFWPCDPCLALSSISLTLSIIATVLYLVWWLGMSAGEACVPPLPSSPMGLWMQTKRGSGCSMYPAESWGKAKKKPFLTRLVAPGCTQWVTQWGLLPTSNPGTKCIMMAWRLQSLGNLLSTII